MKSTKANNNNKLFAMIIILITVIALLCISGSSMAAQADVSKSAVCYEQKEYSEIDIEDDQQRCEDDEAHDKGPRCGSCPIERPADAEPFG